MEQHFDPMGRTLLKAAGLWMTVFGALGVLLYLAGLGVILGVSYVTGGIFAAGEDLVGMSLLLAGAIAELTAGILGLRGAKDPRRIGPGRWIWGGLALVLALAGTVHIALRTGSVAWLAVLLGVVTPLAYLGALMRLRRPGGED